LFNFIYFRNYFLLQEASHSYIHVTSVWMALHGKPYIPKYI